MKMERSDASPLSREELHDIEKLQILIERAIADGKLSPAEMESIRTAINADGKITFEELDLCQRLIWEKIENGELEYSWG